MQLEKLVLCMRVLDSTRESDNSGNTYVQGSQVGLANLILREHGLGCHFKEPRSADVINRSPAITTERQCCHSFASRVDRGVAAVGESRDKVASVWPVLDWLQGSRTCDCGVDVFTTVWGKRLERHLRFNIPRKSHFQGPTTTLSSGQPRHPSLLCQIYSSLLPKSVESTTA